jgi:hypothetical protein
MEGRWRKERRKDGRKEGRKVGWHVKKVRDFSKKCQYSKSGFSQKYKITCNGWNMEGRYEYNGWNMEGRYDRRRNIEGRSGDTIHKESESGWLWKDNGCNMERKYNGWNMKGDR